MKRFSNQRGSLDIILILVIFLLAALLGGYVYYQQKQAQKTYDAAGKGVTVAKKAKKAASKPGAATVSWLDITEFGVRGQNTKGITLQYSVKTIDTGVKAAYFTSAELMKLEAGCTTTFGPGGTIGQYTPGTDYDDGNKIDTNKAAKKIGNYYYIYTQPQAYCSKVDANQPMEATMQTAVKNVMATLELKP